MYINDDPLTGHNQRNNNIKDKLGVPFLQSTEYIYNAGM
jgi:hypothetical protein